MLKNEETPGSTQNLLFLINKKSVKYQGWIQMSTKLYTIFEIRDKLLMNPQVSE